MPAEIVLTRNIRPGRDPLDLKAYEQAGGYQALRKALSSMTPQAVQEAVKKSGLRGRGGAGFPTGNKWSFVPLGNDVPRPRYFILNADETEPGTFKDRYLLEGDPHQIIEGVILTSYAILADVAFIFLRWEYRKAARALEKAISEATAGGYLGNNILGSGYSLPLHLHISAGRYICGEESALINSLEGRRAVPRAKPPHPTVCGHWGKPTIVNNVETVANVPHIVLHGPEWFAGLSLGADSGTKLYSASGRVKNPGLWELPMGTPMREVIEGHAGGMREGFRFRGALPGGASTDFVPESSMDVKMDFGSLEKVGSRLGTGALVVLDDKTCPVGMVLNLERFFARESCGWCTPCRDGLAWAARLLQAIEEGEGRPGDLETLAGLAKSMGPGLTFCALALGAAEPLASALRLFRADFERHIAEKRCPWR